MKMLVVECRYPVGLYPRIFIYLLSDWVGKNRFEIKEIGGLIQADRIHNESDSDDTNDDEPTNSPIVSLNEHHEEKAHDDQCNEDFCSTNSDLF